MVAARPRGWRRRLRETGETEELQMVSRTADGQQQRATSLTPTAVCLSLVACLSRRMIPPTAIIASPGLA